MEKNKGFSDNLQDIEKLVTAFCKHEVLLKECPANLKKCDVKHAQRRAYKEMANELKLPHVASVKSHIQSLKTYALMKMRECVGYSVNRGRSGNRDALSYAPDWLKKLEEPWNLVERAVKAELLGNFKQHRAGRRMSHFVWELLLCAERAAKRAPCPLAATRALASVDTFREYARALELDLNQLHGIWIRYYDQAVQKLMDLINLGDCSEKLAPSKRFTLQDWRVADVGLLYDFRLRIVTEASFNYAMTLYPMIILFKLMVAAKDKIDQRKATQLKLDKANTGRQNRHCGARTETEGSTHNTTQTNFTPLFRHYSETIGATSQAQITIDLSEDDSSLRKENVNKKTCNEYETAEIWALVHSKYTNWFGFFFLFYTFHYYLWAIRCGRSASAVLLQKRWFEMKQQTRSLLFGVTSVPLLLAMGKRFPFILTETLPSWRELVRTGQVFMDSDLEPYKVELYNMDLEVPDIDENVLLDEINDWSDDEVEIINDNREVITVTDSDDEQTNNKINNKPKTAEIPIENVINREENNVEIVDDSFIKKLESLDPESAKVKIIFEDESDSDTNEYLNSSEKSYRNDYDNTCANNDINNTIAQYTKETEINKTKDKNAGPSSECTNLNVKISNSNHNSETSKRGNNSSISKNKEIEELIHDFYIDTDDNRNDIQITSPTKEPNSLSGEDPGNTAKSKDKQSDDMETQLETILESNDSLNANTPNYVFNNGSDDKLNDLQTTSPTKEPNGLSGENPVNTIKCKAIEPSDDKKTQLEATLENNEILNGDAPNFAASNVSNDRLNYLQNISPTKEPNTMSVEDPDNTVRIEAIGQSQDMETELQGTLENNDKLNGDVPKNHIEDTNCGNDETISNGQVLRDESENLDTSVENETDDSNKKSPFFDGKLVRISHVILTPLEGLDEWKKFSKLDSINCRRFSVRNFAKPLQLTPKQLSDSRHFFVPIRDKRNGISSRKILEMKQMPNILKQKRRFLTKHLKLSRTYFSLQFWNERNIGLLELCKPVSVKLERLPRVVKNVELADIDEVINPSMKPPATPSHTLVQPEPVQPAPVQPTPVKPADTSLKYPESNDAPTINSAFNVILPNETAVREMIKKIVRNGVVAKIPEPVSMLPQKNDAEFGHKQRTLDKDIREMSARMLKQHEIVMEKKKEKERASLIHKELKLDPNINCSQEWQRQKSQNLIYFNFKPVPDGHTDKDQNKPENKNINNTKKRHKKIKKRKEHKPDSNKTSLNEKVNQIKSIDTAASDVAKDLEINDSSATCVNSCISSDSDSETDRLVIILDNPKDDHLKRKSVNTESDFTCKIAKTDSNAITTVNNTNNISPQSNILCKIAKPDSNATSIVNSTKNIAPQSNIMCKIANDCSHAITIVNNTNNIAPESNIMCKIAKPNSNATTIVNNTNNIAPQSNILCKIAKPDSNATTTVNKAKNIAPQSNIMCKIAKPNSNATTIVNNTNNIAPNCVIDLCDDSNDVTAINTLENVADDGSLNVHNNKATNNESSPQIKIKIVKNKIEINGDCKSQVVEKKSEEVLTFLSKVAGKIQANNMTKSVAPATAPATNNPSVYYVIKSVDKNKQTNETNELNTPDAIFTETITNTTTYTQTFNTNADAVQDSNVLVTDNSSSMYYVLKIPDLQSGAATSYVSPLPGLAPQVPIIQNVPAITQMPPQIQEYSPLTNLATYPNHFGEVIDTTYANQLYSLTPMPMQRNNSLPMPITSVTAWPTQNDSTQDLLNMEWQTTNSNQVIYPITVTSGSSRRETVTDVNEVSLSSAPWNKTKQSDVTVTSITSDPPQDNRRSLHTQPKRTYPPKKSKVRQMFINDSFS